MYIGTYLYWSYMHAGSCDIYSISLFCQKLEDENDHLKLKVEDLQRQLTERNMSHDQENSELLRLEDQLGSKVTELYEIHEQIISLIRKESHSW